MDNKRILNEKITLDKNSLSNFFENRAKKYNDEYPYVSINYQDSNPKLTQERVEYEKQKILQYIHISKKTKVLDIGCGIGRWADTLVDKVELYYGTDFSKSLIEIAKKRFINQHGINFLCLNAVETSIENIPMLSFDLIIVSGLLIYLSDDECISLLNNINKFTTTNTQIYIREPIAIEKRLTLNKIFSEELNSEYSAIYRTYEELKNMIRSAFSNKNMFIQQEGTLYPQNLSNRKETTQYFFIIKEMDKTI